MEKLKESKLLKIRDVIRTEDSRVNYLRGLMRIAESDKDKTSAEEGYIYKIAEILGASYSELLQAEDQQGNDSPAEIRFTTTQEKMLFLMQALYMCWLDDDYSEAERKEIKVIGNELGVDLSKVEKIESWVKHGIEWMSAGAELIGLE